MATKRKTTTRKRPAARKAASRTTSSQAPEKRVFAYLSYLFILVLFSFLFSPRDAFTRFHVRQGLILFLLEAVTIMIAPILAPLALVAWAAWVVLSLMGIFYVMRGQKKQLPFIGKYTKQL